MRRTTAGFLLGLLVTALMLSAAPTAEAGKLDLAIARFITCNSDGSSCSANISQYERFMAEYAFGLSPKLMAPASTLGYSGFYLGLEGSLTPVPGSSDRWVHGTAPHEMEGAAPGVMFFPALHLRKGLPWSFELGGTINYLAQSELVALGGDIKWSIFEGYKEGFRGAMPDIAARGSVVRVIGEGDVDMTIVGVDGSISYTFGIGGMISLTPYVGWQYLWTIIRTEPLVYREDNADKTATYFPPVGANYDMTSLSGPNLERMKLFLGLVFQYELLVFTFEFDWGLKTDWDTAMDPGVDPATLTDPNDIEYMNEQAQAEVGHQVQINLGVGMQF